LTFTNTINNNINSGATKYWERVLLLLLWWKWRKFTQKCISPKEGYMN